MRVLVSLLMACFLFFSGCNTGTWSVGGAADYETAMGTVAYAPDANGAAGLMVLTGAYIPDESDDNVAVGPYVEFNVGDVADAAVGRIVPADWWSGMFEGRPARLYGTMAILWETQGGGIIWAPGTKLSLLPNWIVQPTIWTTYLEPGSGANVERDFKALAGFEYKFR